MARGSPSRRSARRLRRRLGDHRRLVGGVRQRAVGRDRGPTRVAGGLSSAATFGYGIGRARPGTTTASGYNRVRLGFGGPITGNLTFYLSGDMLGRRRASIGGFRPPARHGIQRREGVDSVSAGIDTTVAVPVAAASTAWTSPKFAVYRGQCDAFKDAGSADPTNPHVADIRNNYGLECQRWCRLQCRRPRLIRRAPSCPTLTAPVRVPR